MSSAKVWVGLDVSARTTSLCVIDRQGNIIREEVCDTEERSVRAALKGFGPARIEAMAMEAGSLGTHLSRGLLAKGYPLVLVETRSTSKFLAYNRNKTDANDARGLAEVVRLGLTVTTGVRLKAVDTQRLRTKITLRHKVLEQRTALQSALRAIFRLYGRSVSCKIKRRSDVERALADILQKEGLDLSADVWPVVDLVEGLHAYLKQADEELDRIAKADPVCRQLMEVPGVGAICALSFYSAIEDPDRFASSRDVGAYLGLTPKISQSGQMLRLGRISKMGNRLTRMHLNLAAAVLLFTTKRTNAIKDWGSAIASRRGNGKARTAVARKLAVLLLSLWKSGSRYEAYPQSIRGRE